jgi:hypothetical protein
MLPQPTTPYPLSHAAPSEMPASSVCHPFLSFQMLNFSETQSISTPFMVIPVEIGAGLATFGGFFIFLGILLFFDRGLIAIGNASHLSVV